MSSTAPSLLEKYSSVIELPFPPRKSTITAAPIRRRLLLADDDVALARVLARKVGGSTLEVHSAISGDTAMDLVRILHFDVAVLDVNMPGMNGLDIIRRIRASHDLHQPAVVVISAFPDEPSVQEAMDAGADVALPKPLTLASLRTAIQQSLDRRG
ncbi:response regulator [Kineococcus terrestris]|uniref:response regulator n=1 Tax=Kineococcus terrestris TaxID=2044856 RepID=UPI0034DB657C